MGSLEDFIRSCTAVASPPLCPEIALHLAGELTPLWEATEATLKREGLPPPFWAFCWPGGQVLARWVLDNPDIVHGRRVLDLGGGCGIGAIAAARAGATAVLMSEVDPFAEAACRLNASLNEVEVDVILEDLVGTDPSWDVLLAGDVCYERPMAESVVSWLRCVAASGARVLLGDPGRNYLPANGLRRLATYRVPTSLELEDAEHRDTVVYEVE